MSPRCATALALLRQNTSADVILDGYTFVIVQVNEEICGTQFLTIDERQLNLGRSKSTGRPRPRDHLQVVK